MRKILIDVPPKPRVISRINSNNLAQTLSLFRGTITFQNLCNLYLRCGPGSLRYHITYRTYHLIFEVCPLRPPCAVPSRRPMFHMPEKEGECRERRHRACRLSCPSVCAARFKACIQPPLLQLILKPLSVTIWVK